MQRQHPSQKSKNFLWEVGDNLPNYYDEIKYPMCLAAIAAKLYFQEYDEMANVALEFYYDVRQVIVNSLIFGNEYSPLTALSIVP